MSQRVVITDQKAGNLSIETEVLQDADLVFDQPTTPDELIDTAEDADALVVDGYTPVNHEVLTSLNGLEVVVRAGIGVDNIDVDTATDLGIQVVNVPEYCADEVAVHTLTLLLGCLRNLPEYTDEVENERWNWKSGRPVYRLQGKTLGLIGFGTIAKRLTQKVSGFDISVVAYDPGTSKETMREYDVEKVRLHSLAQQSDLVSLHLPLTDQTRNLVDRDFLDQLQENAIIVNTSRGNVVDQQALKQALLNDEILAAGLDVLAEEPPDSVPFADVNRSLVTPHVAWYSEEGIEEVRQQAAMEAKRVLNGKEPDNPVNNL